MNKTNTLGLISALIVSFAASASAVASRGETVNFATLRQEREDRRPASKLVRIEGALSCALGAENRGGGCELKLEENGSGRIYNLIQADIAMRLYLDGKKNVLIEGRLAGAETVEVKTAQTL